MAETRKIIMNPRAEIDTSPPFESVKQAVDRFGGSGPWIPHHLLRFAAANHETNAFDVDNIEERALQLERDLIIKENQTLSLLKQLESAKKFVENLKLNLTPQFSSFMENHTNISHQDSSPGLIMELNHAKLNLNKTSIDLAAIQASVQSLNKKITKDKLLLETKTKEKPDLSLRVETRDGPEQFKKMMEASRYEVIKAITEIERTKNSIKMAEMRLIAAKKMEEAAKAVEAIAFAEKRALLDIDKDDVITLSFEEYRALTQKASQDEEICSTKFIDKNVAHGLEKPVFEKIEEPINENTQSHNGLKNEAKDKPMITSIGEILSRKLIVHENVTVGRRVEDRVSERRHISLSQMLKEQSRVILHSPVEKQCIVEKKKFGGFMQMQMPISIKQTSKKKRQPLNMR